MLLRGGPPGALACLLAVACAAAPGTTKDDRDGDGVPDAEDCAPDDATASVVSDGYTDADGDGYGGLAIERCGEEPGTTAVDGDCDDSAVEVHPGALELWYDGADEDCSGGSDFDQDGDGYDRDDECDDTDPALYPDPSVPEVWYNGVDENCDGNDGDQDEDGWYVAGYPYEVPPRYEATVGDCWDVPEADPSWVALNGLPSPDAADVHPAASDPPYDGLDEDCAGDDDFDADQDTHRTDAWPDASGALGDDCDDAAPTTYPGAEDAPYDGIDADCAADDDYDADGDGVPGGTEGAPDCDDTDPSVYPGAVEDCGDPADNDCDGTANGASTSGATAYYQDSDVDGYGGTAVAYLCEPVYPYTALTNTDCDDADPARYPHAPERCDGIGNGCESGWTPAEEAGTATEVLSDGTVVDRTATLSAGTSTSPVAFTLSVGGTLSVCSGTWYVTLTAPAGAATIVGPDGASATVLDGAGAGPVLTVSGASAEVDAQGLLFTGGAGTDGGAIHVESGALTLDGCAVTDSTAASLGGGIYVSGGTLSLTGSTVSGNLAGLGGGGIYATESDVELVDTSVGGNLVRGTGGAYGGGVWFGGAGGGGLTVRGGEIAGNSVVGTASDAAGGGLYTYVRGAGSVQLDAVSLVDNAVSADGYGYGGGARLLLFDSASAGFDGVDVEGNTLIGGDSSYGGGLSLYSNSSADLSISASTLSGNTATRDSNAFGGGLFYGAEGSGGLVVSASTIADNQTMDTSGAVGGGAGGAYLELHGDDATLTGVTVTGNDAAAGDGMFVIVTGGAEVRLDGGTDVYGNLGYGVSYAAFDATSELVVTSASVRQNSLAGLYLAVGASGAQSAVRCEGSRADRTGFWGNPYGLAGVCEDAGGVCLVTAVSCDFGASGGAYDNTTADLAIDGGNDHARGDDETFTCVGSSCS